MDENNTKKHALSCFINFYKKLIKRDDDDLHSILSAVTVMIDNDLLEK